MSVDLSKISEQDLFLEISQYVKKNPDILIDMSELAEEHCFEIIRNSGLKWDAVTAYVEHCPLTSQHRFELAKIFAEISPYPIIEQLDKFNLSEDDRFNLAKELSTKLPAIIAERSNLFNLSDKHNLQLAKGLGPVLATNYFNQFNLNENDSLVLAKMILKNDPTKAISQINSFGLSRKNLFLIAKEIAETNPTLISEYSLRFFQLSANDYFEIIKMSIEQSPLEGLEYLEDFKGLNPEQTKQLCVIAARKQFQAIEKWPLSMRTCHLAFYGEAESRRVARTQFSEKELSTIEPFLEARAMTICAIVDFWKAALTEQQFNWVFEQNFLNSIEFNSEYTESLVYLVEEIAHAPHVFRSLDSIKSAKHMKPLKLLLSRLMLEGVRFEDIEKIITVFDGHANWLKHSKNFSLLFTTLDLLSKDTVLNCEQKTAVILKLSEVPSIFTSHVKDLFVVLNSGYSSLLRENDLDLHQHAEKAFQAVLPGPINMYDFRRVFGGYREPAAMMMYVSQLSTLQKPSIMQSVHHHMRSVLDGSYTIKRYLPYNNQHLQTLLQYDPAILAKWSPDMTMRVQDLLSEQNRSRQTVGYWLADQLIAQQALGDLTQYPFVERFLMNGDLSAVEELQEKCRTKIKLNNAAKHKMTPEEFSAELDFQKNLSMQQKICRIANTKTEEQALTFIKDLEQSSLIQNVPEFRKCLKLKIADIERKQLLDTLSVSITDNAEDITLMGSEDVLTCQSYLADPNLSQGLLGTLQNGQTRLMIIHGVDGKIMARSILRLLWDGSKPVLFLENGYTQQKDPHFMFIIDKMAIQCANFMGYSLAVSESNECPPFENPLISLGGRGDEYVDSVQGLCMNGMYRIGKVSLLHSPKSSEGEMKRP